MKSLKRTLCLVLALVMVLGLFGIASATNFTDDNDIQYKEAVEVVTGIGAINGMGDGTFAPKGNITRAQAATMVARVALTAGVAADLTGIKSSFTDVTVEGGFAWAIPSIEYLVQQGIINGMGDGTFNPNGEISGYAVLKMLLCVLGYGKNDEYLGLGWDLRVAVDASRKGAELTKGRVDKNSLSDPATREEVALYCYNALGARMVTYNKLTDKYDKDGSSDYLDDANGTTLGDTVYKLQKIEEGIVTENGATSATAAKNGTTTVGAKVFNLNTGLDLIGHYVKVYYTEPTAVQTAKSIEGTAYAVIDDSTIVNVAPAFTATTGSDAKFRATFGAATTVAADGTGAYTIAADHTATANIADTIVKAPVSGNADQALANAGTYILHGNEIKAFITPATYVVTAVSKYTAPTATAEGKLSLTGLPDIAIPRVGDTSSSTALAYASYKIYDNPAEKDIVIYQTAGTGATALTNVSKAAILGSGVVTDVDTAAGKQTLTAGGVKYAKSQVQKPTTGDAFLFGDGTTLASTWDKDLLGKTCAFFGDSNGQVVAIGIISADVESNLAYVVKNYPEQAGSSYGAQTWLHKIQCVTPDGKIVDYIVGVGTANDNSSAFGNTGAAYVGKVCKIATETNSDLKLEVAKATVVSAGTKENAASVAGDPSGDGSVTVAATSKFIAAGNYYDAGTQFIYITRATTGGQQATSTNISTTVPSFTNKMTYAYYGTKAETDMNYTVKYVFIESAIATGTAAGIVYLPGSLSEEVTRSYTKADGKIGKAVVNKVYKDGEPYELLLDADDATGLALGQGFYSCTVDAQGICKLSSTLPAGVTAYKPAGDTTDQYLTNVYTGNGKTYVTTGTHDSGVYTAVNADMTANDVKVVDPVYDALTDKTGATNHNTLTSLVDQKVAYVYSTTATGEKVVSAMYFVAGSAIEGRLDVKVTAPTAANLQLNATPDAWADTTNGGKFSATEVAGATYKWELSAKNGNASTLKTVTGATAKDVQLAYAASGDGKITGTGTYILKCTVTKANFITATYTVTFEVTKAS